MRYWELLRLALGGIRRTPLRVTLTALGVAIGTGALVAMVGYALGIQEKVEAPFHRLELLNRMEVTPKSAFERAQETDNPSPPAVLDEDALNTIRRLSGVLAAYPEYNLSEVEIKGGKKPKESSATGMPRELGRLRYAKEGITAGRFFHPKEGAEVILGRQLAKNLGFDPPEEAIDRTLLLKATGAIRDTDGNLKDKTFTREVKVVGIWDPTGGTYGWSTDFMILPLDIIREVPTTKLKQLNAGKNDTPGYAKVIVRVEHPADLYLVEERIQKMGFKTHNLLTQIKEMRTFFLILQFTLTAVGTIALTVAGLGIINTMLMAVLERYREIGAYKALGASDGDIRVLFLAEACLVGLLGGLGGLLLGRVVAFVIEIAVNKYAKSKGIEEPIVAFAFPLWLLIGGVLFALLVSLISGVYPASRAARVDPIRALRAE